MRKSRYTEIELEEYNLRRENVAYDKVKSYIIQQQKRFFHACNGSDKKMRYQLKNLLKDTNSLIYKLLTIPTQTLKNYCGYYVHNSRTSRQRIPLKPILEKLEREGYIKLIRGSKQDHRANIFYPGEQSILMFVQNVDDKKTKNTKKENKMEDNDKPTDIPEEDIEELIQKKEEVKKEEVKKSHRELYKKLPISYLMKYLYDAIDRHDIKDLKDILELRSGRSMKERDECQRYAQEVFNMKFYDVLQSAKELV